MTLHDEYDILGVYNGAFATVYKARHKRLGYVRAVKELKDAIFSEQDKAYLTFLEECKVLMKIGNGYCPNIVKMYNPRLLGNHAVVEMDYIEGPTLVKYLKDNHFMPINEVMRLVQDIGCALTYCHHDVYQFLMNPADDHLMRDPNDATKYVISEQEERELINKYRVVHNDIHSGNVMRRDQDGCYVLLDFGLAIQNGHCVKSSSRNLGADEYKAPEKWDMALSDDVPPQCDIYSFGILLFEALTGRVPFEFDPNKFSNELAAQNEMRRLHQTEPIPAIEPLRRKVFEKANPGQAWKKDYPDWLEQMMQKCLAKNPADRYADAYELMADVQHMQEEQHPSPMLRRIQEVLQQLKDTEKNLEKERCYNKVFLERLVESDSTIQRLRKERDDLEKKLEWTKTWQMGLVVLTMLIFVFLTMIPKICSRTDSVSTPTIMAVIDSVLVTHNEPLKDGNGMTININGKVKHLSGRDLRIVAYFYDAQGNPIHDRNNLYSSSNGLVTATSTLKSTNDSIILKDFVLSIPYAELHQRTKDPTTLRYRIYLYDANTSPWHELYKDPNTHTFEFDIKKMPHAMFNKIKCVTDTMVDGKKSLVIHSNVSIVGMKDKIVHYGVMFYKKDHETPLFDKNGKHIYQDSLYVSNNDRTFWKDWPMTIHNEVFWTASNLDDRQKQCSFDIIVRDEKGCILGSVKNKQIRQKQN